MRVVIGEDLFLLRDGLVRLLEAHGFEVVAAVGSAPELLKDRVFSDAAFADAVRTVAAGGTVLDPEVVSRLMIKRGRSGPLAALTPRERQVLSLMAEGRSNAAIAARLFITEKAVSKHAAGIFANLGLAPSDDDNRRVLAVLAYPNS